jgi:cell division septation protein DedD
LLHAAQPPAKEQAQQGKAAKPASKVAAKPVAKAPAKPAVKPKPKQAASPKSVSWSVSLCLCNDLSCRPTWSARRTFACRRHVRKARDQ